MRKNETFNQLNCSNPKIFLVHGQDDEATIKVARLLEKLSLQPILLKENVSSNLTIIEKIEEYSNVGFGVVLYTPCDIGGKQKEQLELKARPRQNVIFEHGYLIGKIGRKKVSLLKKGEVEIPNDVSGLIYTKMDLAGAWKYQLAKEIKQAGYDIDLNKI